MTRLILRLLHVALVVEPVALALAVLGPAPTLPQRAMLSPARAAQARALDDRIEAATSSGREIASLSPTAADPNALISTGARGPAPARCRHHRRRRSVTMAVSGRLPAPQAISEAGVPL